MSGCSRPRVWADTARLLTRLEERDDEIERFRRLLSRLPVPVHEVAYEDLLARRDDVLGALTDFLGVPAPPRRCGRRWSPPCRGGRSTSSRIETLYGRRWLGPSTSGSRPRAPP